MSGNPHILIQLRRKDGSEERRSFQLGVIRIGQAADNDLVLEDPTIERSHAVLVVRDGAFEVLALAQRSGLIVNRKIVERAVLAPGQEFAIGNFILKPSLNGKHPEIPPAPDETTQETNAGPLPPPVDEDDEEDEDDWPAYSVRERLLVEMRRPPVGRGVPILKVVRVHGEVTHGITCLRQGRRAKDHFGKSSLVRYSHQGELEIATLPGLEIAVAPESGDFVPLDPDAAVRKPKWTKVPGTTAVLRCQGIDYYVFPSTSEPVEFKGKKKEFDPLNAHVATASICFHLMVVALMSVFNQPIANVSVAKLPTRDLEQFVDIALSDIKKPEPPKVEAPKPPVEEIAKKEEPKPDKKAVAEKPHKKMTRIVSAPRRKGPQTGELADITQVGVLGKLGGTGLFSPTKMAGKGLVAAASNLDAVRSISGVQTFRVGNLLQAMPGKEVRLARMSAVKTSMAGTPQGDGFGSASVGAKRDHQVKGFVVDINPPPLAVSIRGGLTREEIARVVQENLSAIRYCYEKSLMDDPSLAGKIVLNWTISPVGLVATGGIGSSSLRNAAVHRCLVGEIRDWKFPKPRDGGIVLVSYPFVFNNASF
jgi:pSer/pThr/pTyr-binding forkhead associated (FHA) protein